MIFLLTELFLQNLTFCGAKSKSKRSVSVRYFCTDWCLEHHRFSDLRIFQTGLPLGMPNHLFVCGISSHFPLSGHVEIRGNQGIKPLRGTMMTGSQITISCPTSFTASTSDFRSVMSGRSGSQQKISKRLRSCVEYDSDKGKGNSNYKHGYIYI